jgi:hypothetical protein
MKRENEIWLSVLWLASTGSLAVAYSPSKTLTATLARIGRRKLETNQEEKSLNELFPVGAQATNRAQPKN